jgi:thiol-disulfide isomerase/thioredoxin
MYVLFYSSYCKASARFIQALEKTGESIYFDKVCVDVDNNGDRPNIVKRYRVRKVPSVIANGELYQGIACFKWFNEKIKNKNNTGLNSRENKRVEKIESNGMRKTEQGYEFKRKKCLIDDADVIGGIDDTGIDTPEIDSFITTKSKTKRDALKDKQYNNIYNKLHFKKQNELNLT